MQQRWQAFCEDDPVSVARKLLGAYLISETSEGKITGKIVEVEAYGGFSDPGSHISKGITNRTKIMMEKPGIAYVYVIYGMYNCLNVVAHTAGQAGAVLIRAVEPLTGVEIMQKRRNCLKLKNLCSGPGKLCQAFGITKEFNGHLLIASPLYIKSEEAVLTDNEILAVARVNIDYAGEAKEWPWRFYIKGNKYVFKL